MLKGALMTAPRQVLPGTTYLVTRRCSQRQFLLRPSSATNQVFGYVLALAAQRFGVRIHAYCVLSNHFHLILTDPAARLPAFEQYLDSLVARAINASLGRWETFWSPPSYSAVALSAPEDVLDKTAYVLANPAAAGLVRRARDWPGLWSGPELIGAGTVRFTRPQAFFRSDGGMPEAAELRLEVPPGFASAEGFRLLLGAEVTVRENRAAAELASRGRAFAGAGKVLSQCPTSRPASEGPARRQLRPRVAGKDRWRRIETLARLMDFLRAYRDARLARRRGAASVVFPAGTYLLRVMEGVRCAAPA
jgi:REP element-mobilizing transposase RayT